LKSNLIQTFSSSKILKPIIMKNHLLIIAFVFVLAACSKSKHEPANATHIENTQQDLKATADNAIEKTGSAISGTKSSSKDEKAEAAIPAKAPEKIIRNASTRFKVNSIAQVTDSIKIIAAKYGAYVSNENLNNGNGNLENQIVIRVPQLNFDKLLQDVMSKADYVDYKNVTADDVTAEFTDVQTRLRTKRAVLERYYELMNRAGKITDVLEVEDKIRVLQEEIESMEGRLKLMSDRSAYSTITVTLYELVPAQTIPGISTGSRMISAIHNGWNNVTGFTIFVLNFWPFVIIGCGVLFYLKRRKVSQVV
jgi:hypothetical protein